MQVIQRLTESGFKPQSVAQILHLIDAVMTGHATLAHLLVAAAEVCKVCELSTTHQHLTDGLVSLASEIPHFQAGSVDGHSGTTSSMQFGIANWSPMEKATV